MKKFWFLLVLAIMVNGVYADKKFTVKGIYQLGTELNFEASQDLFGYKDRIKGNYDVDGGFGFGAEYSVYNKDTLEILGGFNFMFTRKLPKLHYKETLAGITFDEYNGDTEDDSRLDTMSFYVKPRYLFEKPKSDNVAGYIAGKLSYNVVSTKVGEVKAKNCFGFGMSAGMIINDLLDCEIAWDRIAGDLEAGSAEGTYDMSTLSLSAGLRF